MMRMNKGKRIDVVTTTGTDLRAPDAKLTQMLAVRRPNHSVAEIAAPLCTPPYS